LYNFSFASVLPSSWRCVLKYYVFYHLNFSLPRDSSPKQSRFDSCFSVWFFIIGYIRSFLLLEHSQTKLSYWSISAAQIP
jgi:hypothetical protein